MVKWESYVVAEKSGWRGVGTQVVSAMTDEEEFDSRAGSPGGPG